mgnify:FL=1
MNTIQDLLTLWSDFLWTYILIAILTGCALYFTWRTRFVQFRLMGEMIRLLLRPDKVKATQIGREELGGELKVDGKMKHVSSFQAFVVALASRIGTGNLAGVATAISLGGPGAVFWMWVLALLGSALAFVESTLAQLYKRRGETSFYGGPAYYMKYGLGKGWMGIVFAILMIVTFGFAYNSVQSNTICAAWEKAFGVDAATMGLLLTGLTLVIIFGGIHRVAKFSSAVVPAMAVVYLAVAVGVVIWNISLLPSVLMTIIKNAFGIDQAAGGVLGVTIMQGIKRGLFSNEAGEGSAPNAAAVATVSHPVKQGLIQALGVFTDTLVVCTCTAFIILMSGVDITAANGIQLTQDALTHEIGSLGNPFMAVMIWCFAFSSIIGNYYYGEANIRYISKGRWSLLAYRLAVGGMVMLGAMVTLDIAWGMADITMALLTLCNLAAILMLSHQAVFLLEDYRRQKKAGRDPVFDPNTMPVIAKQLEGWQSPENHQALPADGGRGISPADF